MVYCIALTDQLLFIKFSFKFNSKFKALKINKSKKNLPNKKNKNCKNKKKD
jgi:hypothetical protein